MRLRDYDLILLDCDGVVLNSNGVKSDAFYAAAESYGGAAARELLAYHKANGGISRYKKFRYFLEEIVGREFNEAEYEDLLSRFAAAVKAGLAGAEVAPGLLPLREATRGSVWKIVSGGDQQELRDTFDARDLALLFDGGIFGSPSSKEAILERETVGFERALFVGDSKYDYKVAREAGADFVFVSDWTEVEDWAGWCRSEGIRERRNLLEIVSAFGNADASRA
ncbi:MAG: HAD family hydrolase [Pseudomonadota bacterium]